jgi:tetratricopeptide (TPR) repeat protein
MERRNMRISVFFLALLSVSFITTSASAQTTQGTTSQHKSADPALQDISEQRDIRHAACGVGDSDACFAIEFGLCADRNPQVAIPACTKQLVLQENRRTGGNVRFERAIRYMLRANAHARQGNQDLALLDYDRAIVAHGSVFWIHVQRGDAYFIAGNFEQALVSYNVAIDLNVDSAIASNNRALILAAAPDVQLRNAPQALTDAQRANALAPGQPAYIDCLAVAYAANGDFERAVIEERRAIDLLPEGNQAVLDDFRSRLNLFENATAFVMVPTPNS